MLSFNPFPVIRITSDTQKDKSGLSIKSNELSPWHAQHFPGLSMGMKRL